MISVFLVYNTQKQETLFLGKQSVLFLNIINMSFNSCYLIKRVKFNKNTQTYCGAKREQLCSQNKCCLFLCCPLIVVIYPILWVFYLLWLVILSLVLSVTKLLAIRQVRDWWLSWILDYKATVQLQLSQSQSQSQGQQVIGSMMEKVEESGVEYGGIWKLYDWIEGKSPIWMTKYEINASVYNNYLISELVVESIPLLILNLVNGTQNTWTFVSYLSAMSSAAFILYGVLKFTYYVGYRDYDIRQFVL